jgi:IS5 family transposase
MRQPYTISNSLPSERLDKLDTMNALLSTIVELVDLQAMAKKIESVMAPERSSSRAKIGRPAYPTLLMLKMVLLQTLYNLSDEQAEYQCLDRLSFQRFLDVNFANKIPDAKTLWLFKEKLKEYELGHVLFEELQHQLHCHGYIPRGGQIVDATLIPVPIQRNTKEENKLIKSDAVPIDWSSNEPKRRQKDTDARWSKKNNKSYYGYKASINIDKRDKFIRKLHVSKGSEHDSQHVPYLIDPLNTCRDWYADSAYTGQSIVEQLFSAGMRPQIQRKGSKGKPLSECQKRRNHRLAQSRCRVEHVFADFQAMGGKIVRSIGLARATLNLQIKGTVYNIRRLCSLQRQGYVPF